MRRTCMFAVVLVMVVPRYGLAFPNACTVVASPIFEGCLELKVTPDVCGVPPYVYSCARISYYVPATYVEVVAGMKDTFFKGVPFATMQLEATTDPYAFAAEGDHGAYSYQAHALTPPFLNVTLASLPCDHPTDRMCFGAMSEDISPHWRSGEGDSLQPKFLAWSTSPKACLLAGAATSLTGSFGSVGVDSSLCSFDRSWMTRYPPSAAPVCTGWGVHFPRSGTVINADQTTASLVIASRIKTLGSEVFMSVPSSMQEKWSMTYPSTSSCFREGQSIPLLLAKGVNDIGRLTKAIPKNYLYTSWQKVSCKRNWPQVPAVYAGVAIAKAACQGFQ